ncbi:hypothetical protein GCM10009814_34530 [Lapillicoccus jejuensis]
MGRPPCGYERREAAGIPREEYGGKACRFESGALLAGWEAPTAPPADGPRPGPPTTTPFPSVLLNGAARADVVRRGQGLDP